VLSVSISPLRIIMDFAGPDTLLSLCRSGLDCSSCLMLLDDVACGIQYLHGSRLVHQDIKPDNIMWSGAERQGRVADFGCMRIENTRCCLPFSRWRPLDMGPRVDKATDAWALGLVCTFAASSARACAYILSPCAATLKHPDPLARSIASATLQLRRFNALWRTARGAAHPRVSRCAGLDSAMRLCARRLPAWNDADIVAQPQLRESRS
jgi:serine/threonine protein kinase